MKHHFARIGIDYSLNRMQLNRFGAIWCPLLIEDPLKSDSGILPLRFAHPVKIRSSAATPVTDLVH
jgi:hypothetical protein